MFENIWPKKIGDALITEAEYGEVLKGFGESYKRYKEAVNKTPNSLEGVVQKATDMAIYLATRNVLHHLVFLGNVIQVEEAINREDQK